MDINKVMRIRKSCRSFDGNPLSKEVKEELKAYIADLKTPFGSIMKVYLLESGTEGAQKLGTYGVVRGAKTFLGVTAVDGPDAMADIGYTFEKVILKATEMGLGTCWMAGTFNRKQFKKAMPIKKNEIFPIITPIGGPEFKMTRMDKIFRKTAGSDNRKPYEELFFDGSFDKPLTESFEELEMVRIAPSAVNRQPWRVVKAGDEYHFYKAGKVLADKSLDLDVGIAACHLDMALGGGCLVKEDPDIECPANTAYLFTWKKEKAEE